MSKLIKKERNASDEFHKRGERQHSKEYCHYIGMKTWMKERHFKKAADRYVQYPVTDMDGSPFIEPECGYPYLKERT